MGIHESLGASFPVTFALKGDNNDTICSFGGRFAVNRH